MNLRRAWAEVIGDAKAPAPSFRSHAPSQRGKQRPGVGIRYRQHGNLGDRACFFHLQPLGVFGGSHARSERVPGIKRHVRDAAALDAIRRAVGPGRERLSRDKSVLVRVGVNQAANGAMFGGNLGLDPAPGMVLARDDNLPLHGNTHTV